MREVNLLRAIQGSWGRKGTIYVNAKLSAVLSDWNSDTLDQHADRDPSNSGKSSNTSTPESSNTCESSNTREYSDTVESLNTNGSSNAGESTKTGGSSNTGGHLVSL